MPTLVDTKTNTLNACCWALTHRATVSTTHHIMNSHLFVSPPHPYRTPFSTKAPKNERQRYCIVLTPPAVVCSGDKSFGQRFTLMLIRFRTSMPSAMNPRQQHACVAIPPQTHSKPLRCLTSNRNYIVSLKTRSTFGTNPATSRRLDRRMTQSTLVKPV